MFRVYRVDSCFDKSVKEVAYFYKKEDAEKLVKKSNVPGSMSSCHIAPETIIYESYEDYLENNPEAIKQRALTKLTEEEKRVLGLR